MRWDPQVYVRERFPDVRVITTDEISAPLQGCVDIARRIIWLAGGLTDVQRRSVLAFEIGQLEQGPVPDDDPCVARAHQRAAEEWAARHLIPLEDLLDGFRVCVSLPEMAALLEVDTPTLRARIRGLTDDEQDRAMAAVHESRAIA